MLKIKTQALVSILTLFAVGLSDGEVLGSKDNAIVARAKQVVLTQLEALQQNDTPSRDAGIREAWAYAHPKNKSMTGPLSRFTAMLRGPNYRQLIDHDSHRVVLSNFTDEAVSFRVTVVPRDNSTPVVYFWTLTRAESGEREGQWATIAVTLLMGFGESLA